jgi:import inner membrane translocase subunit TIM17
MNSPYGERRIGALTAMKARAPVLGGNFGVWGGLFSSYDCAVKGYGTDLGSYMEPD